MDYMSGVIRVKMGQGRSAPIPQNPKKITSEGSKKSVNVGPKSRN